MPTLTVVDIGSFEVPINKRLVLALEEDAGVDQLHRCGGKARCTTCRVEFVTGEPQTYTKAEIVALTEEGGKAVRLSCQILCDHEMTVRAISRLAGSGKSDVGPKPQPFIEPPPEY